MYELSLTYEVDAALPAAIILVPSKKNALISMG